MHPAIFEILPENQIPVSAIENSQELKAALEIQIAHMLVYATERLWQVLYRLDVSEKKVQELLHKNPESKWPQGITELILEREEERQNGGKFINQAQAQSLPEKNIQKKGRYSTSVINTEEKTIGFFNLSRTFSG